MNNPLSKFRGYIEDNKLEFISKEEEERFKKYIASIKSKNNKKTQISMIVKRNRGVRTSKQAHEKSNQNGYFWGVVIQTLISSDPFIGHSPEDMNNGLKCNFLRIGGTDNFPKTRSFADLNRFEFEKKMIEIQTWAITEYQIKIQTVEEYYN